MKALRSILIGLLVWSAVGCSTNAGRDEPLPPTGPTTTVRVENRNYADMTVYVVQGSRRSRLGTVTGAATETFRIPPQFMFGPTSLRFQVDPLGGGRQPASQEILTNPGDEVRLIIP